LNYLKINIIHRNDLFENRSLYKMVDAGVCEPSLIKLG